MLICGQPLSQLAALGAPWLPRAAFLPPLSGTAKTEVQTEAPSTPSSPDSENLEAPPHIANSR